jgi:hypothetical protein
MSEPKRYHHLIKFYSKSFTDVTGAIYCYPDAGMIEDKDGKYVEYEDYARLKAEVERLTKAGDAMVPLLGRGGYHIARIDWNAAKEGKPQP